MPAAGTFAGLRGVQVFHDSTKIHTTGCCERDQIAASTPLV
jgi:hypothetical protein